MFQHKSHLPVSHSPNQRPFCSDRSCGKEKYRVVVGSKKNPYITVCTSSTKEYKSNLSISKLPPKKENTVAIRINSVNTKGKQITICFLGVSFVGLSNGEKLQSKYISSFEWLRSLTEGFPYYCDDVAVPFRLSDPRTCTIITLHLKDKKKTATVSCVVVKSPGVPSIAFCSPASQFCWWEGGNSSLKNYRKNCSTFCVLRIEKVNSFDRGRTTSLRKRRRRRQRRFLIEEQNVEA